MERTIPEIPLPKDPVIRHIVSNYLSNINSEYPKALMLWGEPGIAKTQRVYQAANYLGKFVPQWLGVKWHGCRVMRLGQAIDATEIIGVATIVDGQFSRWFPPETMPTDGAGIFFADEFNLGQPELQNAFRQLVDEGELPRCGYKMRKEWLIIGAGNPPGSGANTIFDIDPIMNNRWDNMLVERPTKEQWLEWAYGSGKIAPSVMSFIDMDSSWLYRAPKDSQTFVQSESWPSYRSWERLSCKLMSVPKNWLDDMDYISELAANAVGGAAAIIFRGFLEYRTQLRNPAEYIDGAKNIELPTATKFKFAMISSVAEYVSQELHKLDILKDKDFKAAKTNLTIPLCVLMERLGEQFGMLLLRYIKAQSQATLEPVMLQTSQWQTGLALKWGRYL